MNVFIGHRSGEQPELLVLPYGPMAAIPPHLQTLEWRHMATTGAGDRLLGATEDKIKAEIAISGYAVVRPTG
ncbi:hypothetical protein [Devosia sp. RR2S18]|uniref:hypothetical protein n=1 Tax=Devosia rhizosphaerae TaxID=3049774 RepID=UPI002540D3F6|nr:hypothetical protein [Devosia sp. RR2S18]WIJ24014.1 hypothetical protein QOV41_13400 [Devosia sp. RR2S18]